MIEKVCINNEVPEVRILKHRGKWNSIDQESSCWIFLWPKPRLLVTRIIEIGVIGYCFHSVIGYWDI